MSYKGFKPFFDENSKILILGSFPSVKSRETDFYYGNPQNRFWRVLAEAFGAAVPVSNDEKKTFLKKHRIALWDVVTECEIKGSLDSSIKNAVIADLDRVLSFANIEKIILNGGKARDIFVKNYKNLCSSAVFLPSTSPLNTRFDKKLWIDALKQV